MIYSELLFECNCARGEAWQAGLKSKRTGKRDGLRVHWFLALRCGFFARQAREAQVPAASEFRNVGNLTGVISEVLVNMKDGDQA